MSAGEKSLFSRMMGFGKSRSGLSAKRDQRDRLHVILSSIGDGVISTDTHGRVEFMNEVAEKLTGWSVSEAIGVSVEEIFKILNEVTREAVDNPAIVAMKEGTTVTLPRPSVLISKEGKEIPIEDSGSPVKGPDGKTAGAVLIFRDITERRRDEQARTLLSYIVESSDDAIVGKNLDGIITSWNTAAERMFGWTSSEAIGNSITIIIPSDRLNEEKGILQRLRRGERIEHFETIRVSKDGSLIDISLTVSPIQDSTGRIIGASKIARNISDRKQAERERTLLLEREQEARANAESANRIKDQFLATVSHELRTPLNAILGWVRLLSTGTLDGATVKRAIETIEHSARAQARLIDDLLDVSRITSGKLQLNLENVNLTQIIQTSMETIRPLAETKSMTIQTKLEPEAAIVAGDGTRLKQVVWNLLSNAVKFTSQGGTIEVTLRRSGPHAEMKVKDSGIGIKSEFLPFLFDPFRQADAKDTRRHGGLGLGLAIVRHIVEMHGGTVLAESEGEGHGATFTVYLPVKETQLQERPARPKIAGEKLPNLHHVRALVVDDEDSAREIVAAVLKQCGAEVAAVSSADDALVALAEWHPNVLISDIAMPDQNGYELISRIRALEPHQGGDIPAVALTAYAKSEDRLRALSAGFQTHVAKPIEPSELAMIVAGLLQPEK